MNRDKIGTQTCYIHQCTNKVILMYIACLCPTQSCLCSYYTSNFIHVTAVLCWSQYNQDITILTTLHQVDITILLNYIALQ